MKALAIKWGVPLLMVSVAGAELMLGNIQSANMSLLAGIVWMQIAVERGTRLDLGDAKLRLWELEKRMCVAVEVDPRVWGMAGLDVGGYIAFDVATVRVSRIGRGKVYFMWSDSGVSGATIRAEVERWLRTYGERAREMGLLT